MKNSKSKKESVKSISIEDKKVLLQRVKTKLKKQYRGIDEQIDTLIDNISGWYLGTSNNERPTIVNMWSITGLGKTSLVRKLMAELGRTNKLVEVTLNNESSMTTGDSILRRVSRTLGSDREGVCLFIDEFQNMQTVDKDGKAVRDTPFQDLWTLLSDGRFFTKEEYVEKIIDCFDILCGMWCSAHRNLSIVLDGLVKSDYEETYPSDIVRDIDLWKVRVKDFNDKYDHNVCAPVSRTLNELPKRMEEMLYSCGFVKTYTLEDMTSFVKRLSDYTKDSSYFNVYKVNIDFEKDKVIRSMSSLLINNIDTKTFNTLLTSIMNYVKNNMCREFEDQLRTKNLLIIIAGNQDQLFSGSKELSYSYKDVDFVNEINKKLKWYDLKQILLDNIRPEQISRLGMVHIIYPTLTEKSYRRIIDDRLNVIKDTCKKRWNSTLDITDNFIDVVYRNGVFPTQGVRPLLSLIDNMVGNLIIELTGNYQNSKVLVDIDEKNRELVVKCNKKESRRKLLLEISDREEDCGGNFRLRAAVHEAGHAITWMFRLGLTASIDMAPLSSTAGAWTRPSLPDDVFEEIGGLHEYQMADLVFGLGGRAAESIVFGEEFMSSGCYYDLMKTTESALNLIRKGGYKDANGNGVTFNSSEQSMHSVSSITINDTLLQTSASEILKGCSQEAETILKLCKPVLVEMVEYLMSNVYMSEDKGTEFLKKINKIRRDVKVKPLCGYKTKKQWEMFK